jgi:hypothetical protein
LTSGNVNVALGVDAGSAFGASASELLTNATSSIFIGMSSRPLADSQSNQIVIGHYSVGLGSNSAVFGSTSITATRLQGRVGIGMDPTGATGVTGLFVRAGASQSTNNLFEAQNAAGTALFSVGSTGNTAVAGTLGVTGATTLTDLGGATPTASTTGFDRIVIANSAGLLSEASFSAVVAAAGGGASTEWSLTGNSYTNSAGALGAAPTGTFLGSTNSAAGNDLRLVTSNVVRAVISQAGQLSTQLDMLVNGATLGRGGSGVASNTALGFEGLLVNTSGSNNTALGNQALKANTTGRQNTAIGSTALAANVTGLYNTAVGFAALTASTASGNTAVGFRAMQGTTTGGNNVALGYDALRATTTGYQNTAVGHSTLLGNTTGFGNVALGYGAGAGAGTTALNDRLFIANSTAANLIYGEFDTGRTMINAAAGPAALTAALQVNVANAEDQGLLVKMVASQTGMPFEIQDPAGAAIASIDTSGDAFLGGVRVGRGGSYVASNTTVGFEALQINSSGYNNAALGYQALRVNATGSRNTAIGVTALLHNVGGWNNTAVGFAALSEAQTANENTAVGYRAMQVTTTGRNNVALGSDALMATTTGYQNTAVGHSTLLGNTTGFGNVALGYGAGGGAGAVNNRLFIANSIGANLMYGEFDTGKTMINAVAGPAALTAALQINVLAAADKGLVVRAASGQTGNLFEVQNNAELALLQVASDGRMGIGTAPGAGFALDVNGKIRGTTVYAGATLLTSDARFKTNVQPVLDALALVQRIQGVSFDWNRAAFPERNFSAKPQLGVLAQQVETVLPQLVDTDAIGYKSVNYTGFVPLLIEGMKAQQGQIAEAQNTLAQHGRRLDTAEKALGTLDERTGKIEFRMGKADEVIARLTERADGVDSFVARFDTSVEGTVAVRAPTFQVNNLTAERAEVELLIARRIEAEEAKFKTVEAEEGRMTGSLQARSVNAQKVASGGRELFVSLGSIAPLFEVPEGAHFVVTLTSSDGSYASATVVRAGGQLRVMPSASEGIDLVAQGTKVGVVAASKKVKASWLRTG